MQLAMNRRPVDPQNTIERKRNSAKKPTGGKRVATIDINRDPPDLEYRVVIRKLGALRLPPSMEAVKMKEFSQVFLPVHSTRSCRQKESPEKYPLFSAKEQEQTARKFINSGELLH